MLAAEVTYTRILDITDLALEEYAKHGSFMDKMILGAMRNNAAQALEFFD